MNNPIEPRCFATDPFLSRLSKYNSKDVCEDIESVLSHKLAKKIRLGITSQITIPYNSIAKKVLTLMYPSFWIDSENSGVMLHPGTFTPVWLNAPAINFCRLVDGQRSVDDLLQQTFSTKTPSHSVPKQLLEKYIGFILLTRDLDMINIRRCLCEK